MMNLIRPKGKNVGDYSIADLGMRIAEFQLVFDLYFIFLNPKSEIRNPKFYFAGRLKQDETA